MTILVLVLANIINYMDRLVLTVILPSVKCEFLANDSMLGFLQASVPASHWTRFSANRNKGLF